MKDKLESLLLVIAGFIVPNILIYLTFSFYHLSLNPLAWSEVTRVLASVLGAVIGLVVSTAVASNEV